MASTDASIWLNEGFQSLCPSSATAQCPVVWISWVTEGSSCSTLALHVVAVESTILLLLLPELSFPQVYMFSSPACIYGQEQPPHASSVLGLNGLLTTASLQEGGILAHAIRNHRRGKTCMCVWVRLNIQWTPEHFVDFPGGDVCTNTKLRNIAPEVFPECTLQALLVQTLRHLGWDVCRKQNSVVSVAYYVMTLRW